MCLRYAMQYINVVKKKKNCIHVTLPKDLRQALSYLTRLTYLSSTWEIFTLYPLTEQGAMGRYGTIIE